MKHEGSIYALLILLFSLWQGLTLGIMLGSSVFICGLLSLIFIAVIAYSLLIILLNESEKWFAWPPFGFLKYVITNQGYTPKMGRKGSFPQFALETLAAVISALAGVAVCFDIRNFDLPGISLGAMFLAVYTFSSVCLINLFFSIPYIKKLLTYPKIPAD